MEKINLEVEKYSFKYDDGDNYYVFAVPSQKDKDFTEFYIQKEDYGFISFCISVDIEKMNSNNQDFINEQIIKWIESYEDDIEVLEDESALQEIRKSKIFFY